MSLFKGLLPFYQIMTFRYVDSEIIGTHFKRLRLKIRTKMEAQKETKFLTNLYPATLP